MKPFIKGTVTKLFFVAVIAISFYAPISSPAQTPDPSHVSDDRFLPKPLMNSIYLGVGAGFLIGAATSTHLRLFRTWDDIDMMQVMRGMSWGLYGGILLGLYVTYGIPDETLPSYQDYENYPDNPNQQQPNQGSYLRKKSSFAFYTVRNESKNTPVCFFQPVIDFSSKGVEVLLVLKF